nr:DUF2254 domain-containing protein [Motilibacter aurantiacus]
MWPVAAGAMALGAGLLLSPLRPDEGTWLARWAWPGDVDAASAMLQTLTAASIATITLTFSLTVVALQLASQQFSPRLLRDFTRDRVTKSVLAVLVATFVFAVTVLRGLDAEREVPVPALLVAFALGVASVIAVLVFIDHIVRLLRVDTMMRVVHDEAARAIATFYPAYDDDRPRAPDELGPVDLGEGALVVARRSGFVRLVDVDTLVDLAAAHRVRVWVESRPGDHVTVGAPVATLLAADGGAQRLGDEGLRRAVAEAVVLGYERTIEQDAAFGFRQLTDIAVKALSPGINDPVTAVHAVGYASDLLVALTGRHLGPTLHADADGTGRVVVGDRDLRYYLDLVCGQVRRYGAREPTVLVALLRMLRDVAVNARDEGQRAEVSRQVALVMDEMPDSLTKADVDGVVDLATRVRAALDGDVGGAYRDRSGETRSL